jgi:hypothetical protein
MAKKMQSKNFCCMPEGGNGPFGTLLLLLLFSLFIFVSYFMLASSSSQVISPPHLIFHNK